MGMQTVVILNPFWQLFQRGFGICQVSKGDVVSLKGFDKALGQFIGLRASVTLNPEKDERIPLQNNPHLLIDKHA
jgi:hypothetical protein